MVANLEMKMRRLGYPPLKASRPPQQPQSALGRHGVTYTPSGRPAKAQGASQQPQRGMDVTLSEGEWPPLQCARAVPTERERKQKQKMGEDVMGRQRLTPQELAPDVAAPQENSSLPELYSPTPIGFSWADEMEEAELLQPLPPLEVAPPAAAPPATFAFGAPRSTDVDVDAAHGAKRCRVPHLQ